MFSNINELNFTEINGEVYAKAWAILYHFKSKSFDSLIYEEFQSIALRNAQGKKQGHELF